MLIHNPYDQTGYGTQKAFVSVFQLTSYEKLEELILVICFVQLTI